MADKKISQLTTLAQADVAPTADFLPIVDTGSVETKKVTPEALVLRTLGATTGNVGIGTTSPAQKLDVNGVIRNTTEVRVKNTLSNVSYLTFEENGNANSATFISGDARTTGNMGFWTNSTERMRLDASGNLGIGTASPTSLLHLSATRATQAMVSTTGTNDVLFRQTNTGGNFSIGMDDSGGTNYGSAYCAALFHTGARDLLFGTNNTERARIDSNGNFRAGAAAALATNATNGFLYVPTCAGVPTGTPTAVTGMAPIVVDTTNNRLYFYSGGAWRNAGP